MTSETTMKKHVLVVEDDPDYAALLQSILSGGGYAVETAYNCEDAFSAVRRRRPDVITLDIQMPKKSGALFFRTIKATQGLRHVPVVVVTGLTRDDRDMENMIRAFLERDNVPHPEAYVEKPVDGAVLLKTIENVLSSAAESCC